MHLTESEKAEIRDLIDRGEPLPDNYRWKLFREPHEAELIWPGKTHEVTSVVLPFQSIEQVDEPRAEAAAAQSDLFQMDRATGRQTSGWSNKLIWGDNRLVLASFKNGPLRREIEAVGGLKLVYIDPPFDVGDDFSFEIDVGAGDERVTKEPSVLEDVAYRDTWGRGRESYISMFYERARLAADLLSPSGSLYVHCDWHVGHSVKIVLDEVFGYENFRNHIVWKRSTPRANTQKRFSEITDYILFYSKSESTIWHPQFTDYQEGYADKYYSKVDEATGKRFQPTSLLGHVGVNPVYKWKGISKPWRYPIHRLNELNEKGLIYWSDKGEMPRLKRFLDEQRGLPVQSLWDDIPPVNSQAKEDTGYATQKPEALLKRILETSSNPGDLVADFFCGSGTTLAVAEKLGRKWIGCDLGRFAIHTARKRLIGVQRQLKAEGEPYRSFEILNLGKYERQYFVGIDPTLPEEQRRKISAQKEEHYLNLILSAYKAERVFQSPPFHGRQRGAFVLVGPVDAPVTRGQVLDAVDAARKLGVSQVHILGFEFEMGLQPQIVDEARGKGVNVTLRYIPRDVFDKRAVEKGQVTFYDVAYVEAQPLVKGRNVTVKLKDFGVSYRQDEIDALTAEMKNGATKVTVAGGQVVKVSKDKSGIVRQEILTKQWTDWIDYWAVDFDYTNRPETIVVTAPDATGRMVERPQWTGGYIFENEWQSFRTRRDRTLELESAPHEYDKKGRYKIAVKVIDIFGNDTTKVVEVTV